MDADEEYAGQMLLSFNSLKASFTLATVFALYYREDSPVYAMKSLP